MFFKAGCCDYSEDLDQRYSLTVSLMPKTHSKMRSATPPEQLSMHCSSTQICWLGNLVVCSVLSAGKVSSLLKGKSPKGSNREI